MTRSQIFWLLALVAALPAAAIEADSLLSSDNEAACFSTGSVTYRLTHKGSADYTIKIDNSARKPDVTLEVVDDAAAADFVLADGAASTGPCIDAHDVRSIRIDMAAREPDLTIALLPNNAAARYKIYANSVDFSAQDAAALFAVMVQTGRRSASLRKLPPSEDITGALTPSSARSSHAARQ